MSWYKPNQPCVTCGTPVVDVVVMVGDTFSRKDLICPNCHPTVEVEYKCKICGTSNKYLTDTNRRVLEYCQNCRDNPPETKNLGPAINHIESWRLKIDDMPDGQVLEKGVQVPGMPTKSAGEWKEYYNQPREVKKAREYQNKKKELAEEILG